ncbi:MAG: hypothetical protein JRE40_10455 [Deltaproteobacteria bacterium]|nr:hypothetical protein [Deltaproteobacteria bacterium]
MECDGLMGFTVKMGSYGCCPMCGHTVDGSVCETVTRGIEDPPGVIHVAWTIFKLKVVRWLLRPLLRFHIWYISREKDINRVGKGGS